MGHNGNRFLAARLRALFVLLVLSSATASAQSGDQARARPADVAPPALNTGTLLRLVSLPRAEFTAAWDSLRRVDEAASASASETASEMDSGVPSAGALRTRYLWAMGRVLYPYFHWRETDAAAVEPDPALDSIVRALPLELAAAESLSEYRQFLGAYIHERARTRIATDPSLTRGDNRWLRAELSVVEEELRSPALRLAEADRLLAAHIEENGGKGLDDIFERYRALAPTPERLAELLELRASDLARRNGHEVAVYTERDGVPLEVHVLPPTASDSTAGAGAGAGAVAGAVTGAVTPGRDSLHPAMLWIHGGSLNTGTWWHCPVFCTELRARGVTVIAVELRTGSRFESGPLEQLDDATTALAWTHANAPRLGIDAERIGVAGFSSGATIALLLASRTAITPGATQPAAVMALGACADPIAPHEDGFFRKRIRAVGLRPADYSPLALARGAKLGGIAPLLVVHGGDDEYCSLGDAEQFVGALPADRAAFVVVPDAPHFFPFYMRSGQQQLRDAIGAALGQWGWTTRRGAQR